MRMTIEQAIAEGILFPASRLEGQAGPDGGVSFGLPIEVVSEANQRAHWAVKARRSKRQKRAAYLGVLQHAAHLRCRIRAGEEICLAVTLVRLFGPRQRPFDSDNLAGAFKAVRDGIAAAFGIDDGSDLISWHCAQEPGPGGKGGVRVIVSRVDL